MIVLVKSIGRALVLLTCILALGCTTSGFKDPGTTTAGSSQRAADFRIIGHRGAMGIAPENTLASFQAALDSGADVIELDVHLSADGKVVVLHDPSLVRLTGKIGYVSELSLNELKQLNVAANFKGDSRYGVQTMPTLQEVYDLVSGKCGVNVEIKLGQDGKRYPGIEQKVVEIIRDNDAIEATIVSSFDFATLLEISALESDLKRTVIISTDYFKSFFLKTQGSGKPAQVVEDLSSYGFKGVAVQKDFLSEELLSLLKEAGFTVSVWVVNDTDEMWQWFDRGIDMITTDRPDLLVQAFRNKGNNQAP